MTPHHGDADMYISTSPENKFPNKTNFSYRSILLGGYHDKVTVKKSQNKTLEGVYYIGIYGFTFTSYSIVATVHRNNS